VYKEDTTSTYLLGSGVTLTATGTAAEAKDQVEAEATEGRLSVNGEYLEWIVES